MQKYFVFWGWGSSTETKEFFREDEMIEDVGKHYLAYGRHPEVIYGTKLEFEPAEIVKSWKVKEPNEK